MENQQDLGWLPREHTEGPLRVVDAWDGKGVVVWFGDLDLATTLYRENEGGGYRSLTLSSLITMTNGSVFEWLSNVRKKFEK